ncbi:MAG TPA: cation diffusion facilitator family transporter [Bacteroidales bacterium]|nr:cation diffusion facilitator family transporter [Bacteroidales bacterium]
MNDVAHKHHGSTGRNILVTIILNTGITVAQIVGGLVSGSMALLSDAAHNFSDVLSLVISYLANRLSLREQTLRQTFGFRRAEIFAAFINSATLLVIAGILIWQAVTRLIHPKPVSGSIVIWLAALGAILNGISLLFIRREISSMNMRSAFLHLFIDMMTSVAVLAGGFAIKYLEWNRVDGILTLIISSYLIYSSWGIFYESIRIFMQFTPSGVDIEKIAGRINTVNGVRNIHHVHVWQLDDNEILIEAHLDLDDDYTISRFEDILEETENILKEFGIHHFNIQPEYHRDDMKSLINVSRKHERS